MVEGRQHWSWILGNHDAAMPNSLPGVSHVNREVQGIILTHEVEQTAARQIIGHFHPKLRMKLSGHRVSGKCFLLADDMLVMPAFGAYTGGLDCEDMAITSLSKRAFLRYLLYRGQVWKL